MSTNPGPNRQPFVLGKLTPRERDILRLMAADLSNAEIAERLVMTPGTIKWYTKQIYSKLGVHSRDEAIARAAELDLTSQSQSAQPISSNLPARTTSLVGRELEIAAVRQRLLQEDVRLLTLVGTPGIGKTRLSLETASTLSDQFPDGVYFIALAPLSDPALVASAIAQPLNVQETAGQSINEMLKYYLREKCLLLVLDNFEHLLSAAPLVAELLAAAPRFKVLATSREPLSLYGEQQYPVPPLALPARNSRINIERLSEFEAVALFVRRAQAVKPDFELTPENANAVADICIRLDGLPLAIELAAARTKLYSPQALLERLNKSLSILAGGALDLPQRHQTLHNAIAWSYDLLNEDEKKLFTRLGVFVGGWSLEAMEAVCVGATHESPLSLDVYDGLESLLNKSLIQQIDGANGEPRFTLLETLREYALEKLAESGEENTTRQAHAQYFMVLAERAAQTWRTPDQRFWFDRLESERDNIRATLRWYHNAPDGVEPELRMIGILGWLWFYRYHFAEDVQWAEAALAHAGDIPPRLRAQALMAAVYGAFNIGDFDKAADILLEVLPIIGESNDPREIAFYRFCALAVQHNQVEAVAGYEELVAQAHALNDVWLLNTVRASLGEALITEGDFERAELILEEGLSSAQEYGDSESIGELLVVLATLTFLRGKFARAKQLCQQYLELHKRIHSQRLLSSVLTVLGNIALIEGRYSKAESYLDQALKLGRSLNYSLSIMTTLWSHGDLALAMGNLDHAVVRHREALLTAAQMKLPDKIACALELCATSAFALGGTLKAAHLFAAADALRQSAGTPTPPIYAQRHQATIANIRAQLAEATFNTAWAEGAQMTLDEAVAYVLDP
jgi:predicted ATPase/DNA-binding CsgD family transcriptional regulator/uncharacterized protein HemY